MSTQIFDNPLAQVRADKAGPVHTLNAATNAFLYSPEGETAWVRGPSQTSESSDAQAFPANSVPSSGAQGQTSFEAHGISIRPFRLEDARPLYDAVRESLGALCGWMIWCRLDYSLEDSRSFIASCDSAWERGEHYSFAIIDAKDQSFLGSVGLNHLNRVHNFANVGYWVRQRSARRGIATAATRLIAWFGLNEIGLERLEILVPTSNVASLRVAQKAGAKFEGILRHRLLLSGRRHDAAMYSIVANDLPHQR